MQANKFIFDIYSTSGGKMNKEDYQKFYDENDLVYIVLVDERIYTTIKRQEMFDKGLNYGCFIEHKAYDLPIDVIYHAQEMIRRYNARFVSADEFKAIEQQGNELRTHRAFRLAEMMIRGC